QHAAPGGHGTETALVGQPNDFFEREADAVAAQAQIDAPVGHRAILSTGQKRIQRQLAEPERTDSDEESVVGPMVTVPNLAVPTVSEGISPVLGLPAPTVRKAAEDLQTVLISGVRKQEEAARNRAISPTPGQQQKKWAEVKVPIDE